MTKLCYECDEFDEETLKCKKYGTYVYTPTKAERCKRFIDKSKVKH